MNHLKLTWIALISMSLIFSCSNEQLDEVNSSELETMRNAKGSQPVTVPFEAVFSTTKNVEQSELLDCSTAPYTAGNYQEGGGHATHLGNFTTVITFCGAGFLYNYGTGVFVAANGDELYFDIPTNPEGYGEVHLIFDDPFYEAFFDDQFQFTGGTGQFAGASGGGVTASWVNLFEGGFGGTFIEEHQTDHTFTGELTFYPGSKSNK